MNHLEAMMVLSREVENKQDGLKPFVEKKCKTANAGLGPNFTNFMRHFFFEMSSDTSIQTPRFCILLNLKFELK